MKEVVINDINLLKFCESQIDEQDIPEIGDVFPVEKCVCFGQYNSANEPWWVVTLYNFKSGHDCMIGLSLNIKGMFSPSLFKMMGRVIFDYAFKQANLLRCTVSVRASNKASIRLAKAWGFKEEGLKRLAYQNPLEDMYILGLLKSECVWI